MRKKINLPKVTPDVGRRIRELRLSINTRQKRFSEILGCSNSYLSDIESGRTKPSLELLISISENTNCSLEWLIIGKGKMKTANIIAEKRESYYTTNENLIKIPVRPVPVLNTVPAGFPETPIDDYVIDWVMIPIDIKDHKAFGLIVDGDSMAPKINDRDIIIISPKSKVSSGQIGAFRINSDVTIKKLLIKKGKTYLLPENDEYEPIVLNDGDEVISLGRAIYQIKKL